MKSMSVVRRAVLSAVFISALFGSVGAAAAVTLDYSVLKDPPYSLGNNASIPSGFGTTSDVSFSYSTINPADQSSVPDVAFWASPEYGGDQAVFAFSDNSIFQVTIQALNGLILKSVSWKLSSFQSTDRSFDWDVLFNSANLISVKQELVNSGNTYSVDLSAHSFTSFTLRFGNDRNIGLNEVSYTTGVVPVPAALPLLASVIGGLLLMGNHRRRKNVKAAA